jgi:hypothetical protein
MYVLVFLRFLLGLVSGTTGSSRLTGAIGKAHWQPAAKRRAAPRRAQAHEWISMDYVLTESSPQAHYLLRDALERPTHPLSSILRCARRLAGVPKPYPALAATASVVNRHSGRASP